MNEDVRHCQKLSNKNCTSTGYRRQRDNKAEKRCNDDGKAWNIILIQVRSNLSSQGKIDVKCGSTIWIEEIFRKGR